MRGLGAMGAALIQACPNDVLWSGWDPDIDAQDRWRRLGGQVLEPIPEETDLILSLLPSIEALNATTATILKTGSKTGAVWAEASTLPTEAKTAARARLDPIGITMLDTPISGTAEMATQGKGIFFVGGPEEPASHAISVLRRFSARAVHVGTFQNASLVKLVAQHLVMVHTAAAAEALAFSELSGIDAQIAVDALSGTAADSMMLQMRGPRMAERSYIPAAGALSIIAKDLEIVGAKAQEMTADLPLLMAIADRYREAITQDPKRDLAAIFESYVTET